MGTRPAPFTQALDPTSSTVTVLGSFRETALIVEAGLTGGYVPARV
jgi:hypothetical protein